MMASRTLLLVYSCMVIVSLQKSVAKSSYCNPSSCGSITNISYPFRLKRDPKHCGHADYELACENNVTFLYLRFHKYYVKQIFYNNSTIRLVDASVNINDTCSFPTYVAYPYNFSDVSTHHYQFYYPYNYVSHSLVNLISCPHVKNSSLYINITHCQTSNSSNSRFTYIIVGYIRPSDVKETCRVDEVAWTSWKFKDRNVSLEEIHRSLLYGFELDFCSDCYKSRTLLERIKSFILGARVLLLIPVAIVVFISAGVSLPVLIIVGFTFGLILLYIPLNGIYNVISMLLFYIGLKRAYFHGLYLFTGTMSAVISIITLFVPRFFIYPLVVWLLIYKFRRRHLSMFEAIESFLQSNNNLMPIRYKYSDIHKITKGFQHKLGEGGYGFVYKGKLQSGYHVAIKLLGKSSANSQDFMNEIATIGRIHHVNIVKLVGYCAERSKRALIFDFMPNGSLDKYIFNEEEKNCLDWDTKFRIAIGVARGIEYLHCGCDIQILHFDIKPHNILLDDKFVPKISDFGLAKLCSIEKDTVTLTAARGTIGYVAPELINRNIGRVSYKADVYSFGMMLMGMVGFNRNLKGKSDDSTKYFPYCVYDHLNQDRELEIGNAEETINGNDGNDSMKRLVRKMTIVALWCIQMCPDDRPSMSRVLKMLESDVECLRIPDYPSNSQHITVNEDETWLMDDSISLLHSNEATNFEIRIEVEHVQTLQ